MIKVPSSFSNEWTWPQTAWSPSQWSSGQTFAILQPDVPWGDWCHEFVCDAVHPLFQYRLRSTRDIVYRIQMWPVERICVGYSLTLSVPHFFWSWQKWVYQSVQRHTGQTHAPLFVTFGHSGAQCWFLSARVCECQNIKKGGLDQYGPELWNVTIWHHWAWKG